MITIQSINEDNYLQAAALCVREDQRMFVASAPLILARAYAYRGHGAICWGIYADSSLVGLVQIEELEQEPACYHLAELLIDVKEQGKGYGQAALCLVLNHCRREGKYPMVELCVKKENAAAIHVYQKLGFADCGYIDPTIPDSINMVYPLKEESHGD